MAIAQRTPVERFLWHFRAYRVIFTIILLTLASLIFLWIHTISRTGANSFGDNEFQAAGVDFRIR